MSKKSPLVNYDSIKMIINSLLLTYKNGLNLRSFQKLYEENILEQIPFKELGYCSLEQFFLSMPDAVNIRYLHDGVMILNAKCDVSNAHLKNLIDNQKINKPVSRNKKYFGSKRHWIPQNTRKVQNFKPPRKQVPEWTLIKSEKDGLLSAEIKDRLSVLISKYSSGLESKDLLKAYYHEYKDAKYQNDLSYKDYGFRNCEELFLSLKDIFVIEKSNCKILFHPKISLAEEVVVKEKKELECCRVIEENYTSVSINDFIDYIDGVPYLHVSIGEVYSPYNFSMIVNQSSLDELMNEIQDFYKEDILKDWKLVNEHIVLNHPVVVLYAGAYNRAMITTFKGLDLVEVICVDYGTTYVVSRSELLYLHKKFLILPSQAVTAKLYGIKPIKGIYWENCKTISERFLQLIAEKECLFAEIIESKPLTNKLSVRIIDTEDDEKDVCINDILVTEKFALSTIGVKIPIEEMTNALCSASLDEKFDKSERSLKTSVINQNNSLTLENGGCETQDSFLATNFHKDIPNNHQETVHHDCNLNGYKSGVNQWLQHLPHSIASSSTPASSCTNGFITDALMHIDAACQSIYDKRNVLISQLQDVIDNDDNAHSLIMLNTCVRALKSIKTILAEVDK